MSTHESGKEKSSASESEPQMNEPNILITKYRISETEEIEAPLHFEMSSFIPSVLAHHLSIQGTPDNILVGFYEIEFPILLNPTPEAIEKLKQEGYIAECVARIAIPNSRFQEFARVLAQAAGLLPAKESKEQNADNK